LWKLNMYIFQNDLGVGKPPDRDAKAPKTNNKRKSVMGCQRKLLHTNMYPVAAATTTRRLYRDIKRKVS